jgi:hypothetical protein
MIESICLFWEKMNSLDDLLKVGNSTLLIKHPSAVDLDFNPNGYYLVTYAFLVMMLMKCF